MALAPFPIKGKPSFYAIRWFKILRKLKTVRGITESLPLEGKVAPQVTDEV